ncbi:hypothetical protein CDAR_506031 [Caerostris darwini]|uniref:Uncharacterized protein n=1 Tax=Caerostris darwini TaxID=1538125 RepID=A0AAV4WL19_9ARAC|nr:hypothetical protein CDAR_506031 [Caerostris darwini]
MEVKTSDNFLQNSISCERAKTERILIRFRNTPSDGNALKHSGAIFQTFANTRRSFIITNRLAQKVVKDGQIRMLKKINTIRKSTGGSPVRSLPAEPAVILDGVNKQWGSFGETPLFQQIHTCNNKLLSYERARLRMK